MKPSLLLLLSLFSFSSIKSQDNASSKYLKKLNFEAIYDDYLFIQKTEISNKEYAEFLEWILKNKGQKTYWAMYPDTSVWRQKLSFNDPFVHYYFQHPAYCDYPVVGISWFKAQAYCQWKADRIMESPEFKKSEIRSIRLRLPSEKEWMLAARGGLPPTAIYPWEGNSIRWVDGKKKDIGKIRLNCTREAGDQAGILSTGNDGGFITTPVESYWPNQIGLYNMCGNVAEWVEEKNKAKGGSWNSYSYNARIDIAPESFNDSMSSSTIGFRPVLEIISMKVNSSEPIITLTPHMLEKQVAKINDSLSAAMQETSNLLYNLFLTETKNIADSVRNSAWTLYTRYPYFQQYSSNAKYNYYPVVNISYESAVHFCEWLTNRYNQSKNRSYKEVVFRLPTASEWELAAAGNKKEFYYPWGGSFYRNSRGCYLANFSPLEEQYFYRDSAGKRFYNYPNSDSTISRSVDGAEFTTNVKAYFPNAIGLYNCAGNVAEMTSEKGICKGGSWTSSQNYITIQSHETYNELNANLGFRFFMQIKQKW